LTVDKWTAVTDDRVIDSRQYVSNVRQGSDYNCTERLSYAICLNHTHVHVAVT